MKSGQSSPAELADASASAAAMLRDRVERMRRGDHGARRRPSVESVDRLEQVEPVPEPILEPVLAPVPPPRSVSQAVSGSSVRPRRTPAVAPAFVSNETEAAEEPPSARPPRGLPPHMSADQMAVEAALPMAASERPRMMSPDMLAGKGELRRALEASKRALKAVGWFSCAINVLMLTGPIFMLQVYDRVMTSGSYSTLAVLMGITAALYGVIGMLENYRAKLIARIGIEIDQRVGDRVFEAAVKRSVGGPGGAVGALRELDTLRQFIAGPAPMTAFDLMWTPIYLLVIFLTHWTLGLTAVIGMAGLLACAWYSESVGRTPLTEAGKSAARSIELAETAQRNADSITSMGMLSAYRARWQEANQKALSWQLVAADRLGGSGSVSKTLRLLMQSLMLAVGAALAIRGDISAGAIIAGTIIFGRALAPVEQVITHLRTSTKALEAYKKLEALLASTPANSRRTALPRPQGYVSVEALRVAAPEAKTLILNGVTCEILPGRMVAVIGPSASGKSTFVRALVGLWPPYSGTIKIDGVKLDQWDGEDLGQHIGYLPQDVELFSGTVRDNIARFRTDVTDEHVVAAAKAAHSHDLITALPKGYDTELGSFGQYLSAGQRQRIGLARALFGMPALVVLDEPNANLDRAGDEALAAAIDGMRARGQAIVLVSHRVQAIQKADDLLYIERGVQRGFGPRDEVMRMLQGGAPGSGASDPRAAVAKPPAQTQTQAKPQSQTVARSGR
jgi:ATP-binding cassette, subfamily C, bacterial exporter for protease/lipase